MEISLKILKINEINLSLYNLIQSNPGIITKINWNIWNSWCGESVTDMRAWHTSRRYAYIATRKQTRLWLQFQFVNRAPQYVVKTCTELVLLHQFFMLESAKRSKSDFFSCVDGNFGSLYSPVVLSIVCVCVCVCLCVCVWVRGIRFMNGVYMYVLNTWYCGISMFYEDECF